ncbi:MAG: succinylglutamate desuccinylase/aspartoacylase family protein [Candidatus Nanohalobium sp.]
MKVKTVGDGEPEHAVMYCVHGNEPCGKLAVDRILHEKPEFRKPVKLVFANEKAYKERKSQIDKDLNRVWNSDSNDTHEEKLAEAIKREIKGMTVLDLHSSFSHPQPFGLKTRKLGKIEEQLRKLPVGKSASIEEAYDSQIEEIDRVAVECGYTRTQKTIENAYNITKDFLRHNNIIEGETEEKKHDNYNIYDKVEGSGYQFTRKNFRKIQKGETYAIKKDEKLKAKEDFYPVMMSTTGYRDMIGFKAKKVD